MTSGEVPFEDELTHMPAMGLEDWAAVLGMPECERQRLVTSAPDGPAARGMTQEDRTDPWRWYCRICGAKGEAPAPEQRDENAREHLRQAPCGRYDVTGWAEAGRLLHVWSYPGVTATELEGPQLSPE